jgi:sugar/nucleoside kinase (ribokinase family)
MATGLFVGLVTLDLIYLTTALPNPNQKLVALDYTIAAGGPATNAAIAFRYLASSSSTNSSLNASRNASRLMGVIGCHPVSRFILSDLQTYQVEPIDLQPDQAEHLPASSILVTQATGERAVISINATLNQATPAQIPPDVLADVAVVLIDGHQMAVSQAIAQQAQAANIPLVVDGGSWKPGFEAVLRHASYAICSANFSPPGCQTVNDLFNYLASLGIHNIAITQGEQPVLFRQFSEAGHRSGEIAVPAISPVDTVGAGDFFHGAFCHFIQQFDFPEALYRSAQVASLSCQSFGTRKWMS